MFLFKLTSSQMEKLEHELEVLQTLNLWITFFSFPERWPDHVEL